MIIPIKFIYERKKLEEMIIANKPKRKILKQSRKVDKLLNNFFTNEKLSR